MSTRHAVGARRAVPVEPSGGLRADGPVLRWACEQFDGLLWQLVAMAETERECRDFLRGA